MSYCSNCGNKNKEHSKFCSECGFKLDSFKNNSITCPKCGEDFSSYMLLCPICKYEIRAERDYYSVQQFESELFLIEDFNQKINFIRNYNVPNVKEDIIDFLFLSKSNIIKEDTNFDGKISKEEKILSQSWKTKYDECYSKAKVLLKGSDLLILENINQEISNYYKEQQKEDFVKSYKRSFARIATIIGLVIGMLFLFIGIKKVEFQRIIVSIIQMGLLVISHLMGLQIIPCKSKFLRNLVIVIGFIMAIYYLSSFNNCSCNCK